MAETQLTHKLRNPKSYNEWMNIWTSHIDKEDENIFYKIYPSSDWKIPVNLLTPNTVIENNEGQEIIDNETSNITQSLPIGITVPVDRLIPTEGDTTSTLPDNIKITSNNIPSNSNVFPIMAKSVAGIAKAGTGLVMDLIDAAKVNVNINSNNIDDVITENNVIPGSKLILSDIQVRGINTDDLDEETGEIKEEISSTVILIKDKNIPINSLDSQLYGVGLGNAATPDDAENIPPLSEADQAKCGIWIQY